MTVINGETVGIILFFVGIYGIIARRNIIKTIISLCIIQAAVILFFISTDAQSAPIGTTLPTTAADPVPQALMITAIVVGISVTAVSLTMFITLYHKYGSTNWNKVKKKREEQL